METTSELTLETNQEIQAFTNDNIYEKSSSIQILWIICNAILIISIVFLILYVRFQNKRVSKVSYLF